MRPSEPELAADRGTTTPDWRSWLALGWVAVFGVLYARMVLQERLPGAWEAIRGLVRFD